MFGSFIWMACEASRGWRGPSFQWRAVLLGALRKQALDERCEDWPLTAALCGTCVGFDWHPLHTLL